MSLVISKVFTYDTDAGNYIQAVEGPAGDNQALEPAVRQAINNFVIGCKQDGIWSAIKASCILAGARTLSGALVPLVGTAPTNPGNVFVQADYNRKTGLGSTASNNSKYLNLNRAPSNDPQDSAHIAVYASSSENSINQRYLSSVNTATSTFSELYDLTGITFRLNSGVASTVSPGSFPSFIGAARPSASTQQIRAFRLTTSFSAASNGRPAYNYLAFARNLDGTTVDSFSRSRLAFYSIGESLDLALLDARVTALITAFGVAIP